MAEQAAMALLFSAASLVVSLCTLWMALLRRGTVRMTRPRMLFFTSDHHWAGEGRSKIVVNASIYGTAKRRLAIETMWARVDHDGSSHRLTDWFYKETDTVFTGGLNVGEDGQSLFHHFYLPSGSTLYPWKPGQYQLTIMASVSGRHKPVLLFMSPVLELPAMREPVAPGKGFS